MKSWVIGYGSLISHKSLKQTISDKKFIPVIVKGYKRIFNIVDNHKDVLNLEESKKSLFNGVMFEVDEKELKKINEREDVYNFEKANVYDFKTKKLIRKALIVIDYFLDIDDKKRLPDKKYFILCRESAYNISKEFGKMWDKTTYISNGKKISEFLKSHKEFNTIK